MTTYTWKISATGNWNTGADWTPVGPPNADTAEAVIITVGTHVVSITDGQGFTANQVTLDAADTTLEVASGGTLTLAGTTAALVLSAGTFALDGLLQGGTVEADGATAQLGGTLDGVTWLGPLVFGPGETLTVVSGLTVETATGTSPGTIDMSAGGDTLLLASGETLDNAILNFSGSDDLADATTGGTLTLGSGFSVDGTGGTLADPDGYIVNSGTIMLGAGGTLAPGMTNSGMITIGAGGVLSGNLTNTGSVTIAAGGELAVSEIAGNTGLITVGSGGLLSVSYFEADSGVVTVANGGTFSAFSFASSQPFIDNGLLEVDGSFSATSITIASGATLIGADKVIGGVDDRGLVEANGGVLDLHNAVAGTGVLQIDAGATLQLDVSDVAKVDFAAVGGALILEQPAAFFGTIDGFTTGDTIDLPNVAYDPSGTATMLAGNTLQVVANASTYDLKFDPAQSFTGDYFHVTPDGSAIIENAIPPYYVWTTAISGDWATGADWTPAGSPDAATANAVIDASGSYTVSISNGESFLANALTLAAAGATLSVAGTLMLNEIINDGLIDIVGATLDLSQGTLNNAGVITIGSNGAQDGELILNAISVNGGGFTIAAGGTLDLLGARTLSGDTVAGLGSVTSSGGLLLVDGSLNLGGGTLDVAATGPLSEFGVAGALANGTVDADAGTILLENGAILNGVTWQGTLTVFGTESVAGVASGNGINVVGGNLTNDGTITGGGGANSAAPGSAGTGVAVTSGTLGNTGLIVGGTGGANIVGGVGASGGAGVLATSALVTNTGTIFGGLGGGGLSSAGAGGDAVDLNGGTLNNTGTIEGGAGQDGALYAAGPGVTDSPVPAGSAGGVGVDLQAGSVTNAGLITGGSGGNGGYVAHISGTGGPAGAGGAAMLVQSGSLTNTGTMIGGNGGHSLVDYWPPGDGGDGVAIVTGSVTNRGLIMGGSGYLSPSAGPASGGVGGFGAALGSGSLTNAGTMIGGGGAAGVAMAAGSLTNAGLITGGVGVDATGGSLTNTGTILGGGAGDAGIQFSAGGIVIDSGVIGGGASGTVGVYADAINFGTGAAHLILDPGAGFTGSVVADATFSNVLELASAASAGTLAGLGSQYVGFARITIDAGASWMLNGTNAITSGATLTELSGATLIASGTLVNDGAVVLDPSTMTVSGLTGTGSVTIDAGSTLAAQGTIAGGQTLAFGGSGAYLHLDSPGSVAGAVTNFGFGETIDLKGIDATSVSYADGRLSFSGGSFALSLADTGPVIASTSGDGADVFAPCFRAGTRIMTPSGERLVQELAIGDLVRTMLGERVAPIVWVGRRELDCARHPNPGRVWPVRVAAGAFGPGRPGKQLFLSPDHGIYLGDVLIPVKHLINGSSIAQVPVDRVTYYHLELPEHDVLLADGLPVESYLDTGDRCNFENDGGPIALYPDFSARSWDTAQIWEALGCARLIVTGPELNAARMLVNSCAAAATRTDAVTKHVA